MRSTAEERERKTEGWELIQIIKLHHQSITSFQKPEFLGTKSIEMTNEKQKTAPHFMLKNVPLGQTVSVIQYFIFP